ncbi:hypothetical protein [Roseomonas sp. CECT 9278]|uniref:hypothetical protein n=1 Tax=Roseomonas sp. CECT 9278 TaxID=2845823 RepID=UPI001E3D17D1|nr:hypothetical protein [Roseomonas sp. CECT 9278]CAH0275033.1 hypothetical protein ROS9278_03775 [Roseomonas sp. CECT 9278]
MTTRRMFLLAPLALGACEELRTPATLPPAILAGAPGAGAPLRAAVFATAAAFANQGTALQDRPAETALAIARLEALELEVADRRAWPSLSPSIGFAMRTARDETRAALGVAQRAPGTEVVQALSRTAARLRAGDRAGAAAALPASLFEPGGEATLDRLAAIGPLPAAEQATAALARDVRRLDLDRGWAGAGNWWQAGAPGAITDGLGLGE